MQCIVAINCRRDDVFRWLRTKMMLDDIILAAIPDEVKAAMSDMPQIGQIKRHNIDGSRAADDLTKPAKCRPRNLCIYHNQPRELLAGLCAQGRVCDGLKQAKHPIIPIFVLD